MKQRQLGDSGISCSALGFGTWEMSTTQYGHIDVAEATKGVQFAIDQGITLFDTAEFYGPNHSEILLGKALGKRRKAVVVVTKVGFLFYEDGVTDSVGRLIESVDRERIAIGERLGLTIHPDPAMGMRQGYMLADDYGAAYREAPGFLGIGAQPSLDHRYLNEDVGYGLVFMTALGRQVGVPTPNMDAIIRLTSVLMNRDYAGEAKRTPDSIGIGELTAEQLGAL